MSRSVVPRIFSPSSVCSSCRATLQRNRNNALPLRPFTTTTTRSDDTTTEFIRAIDARPSYRQSKSFADILGGNRDYITSDGLPPKPKLPFHLHILTHKHNTHITLTTPEKDALLSLSTGNLGFRKGARSSYDAAFQLASYAFNAIQERGWLREPGAPGGPAGADGKKQTQYIHELEIILKGFGKGREAVSKALLGTEGTGLRNKVVRVTDGTTLKFGGVRSRAMRRLG